MAHAVGGFLLTVARQWMTSTTVTACTVCNSCMPVCVMQLFCHPKYSIVYGALMIFVVGSGQG